MITGRTEGWNASTHSGPVEWLVLLKSACFLRHQRRSGFLPAADSERVYATPSGGLASAKPVVTILTTVAWQSA